jgi:hypothetical protein
VEGGDEVVVHDGSGVLHRRLHVLFRHMNKNEAITVRTWHVCSTARMQGDEATTIINIVTDIIVVSLGKDPTLD